MPVVKWKRHNIITKTWWLRSAVSLNTFYKGQANKTDIENIRWKKIMKSFKFGLRTYAAFDSRKK